MLRFPMADEVVNSWPDRYLAEVGADLTARDVVCVLTHDHKFDVPAIVAALQTQVGYIGAMGSRRTNDGRVVRLREAGLTDDDIARRDVTDRPRHRRPHARGDSDLDLRRGDCLSHRTPRRLVARHCRSDSLGLGSRGAVMDLGIAGRRAAVAAASKGLGFAVARALVDEGVRVAVCGRDQDRIEAAASDLGAGAVPIVADLSSPAGSTGFVRDARDALGGIDIVVANAGGPPPGNFASVTVDQYLDAFELNCRSTIAMCYEAVPAMRGAEVGVGSSPSHPSRCASRLPA